MERKLVNSSSIRSVGYDRQSQVLEIEFNSLAVYRYENVSEDTYREFMGAYSKGMFFTVYIRQNYPFRCIQGPAPKVKEDGKETQESVSRSVRQKDSPAKAKKRLKGI